MFIIQPFIEKYVNPCCKKKSVPWYVEFFSFVFSFSFKSLILEDYLEKL